MNRNRLLLAAAAGLLAGIFVFLSCRRDIPAGSWLGPIHAEGRGLFYATVRDELARHPLKSSLTQGEVAKIMEAETRYERLYEILVNVFYQKDEPVFRQLIGKGDRGSRRRFAEMYRQTVATAAHHFVEAFFATDAATDLIRKSTDKYQGLDAADLVVRSVGYQARLDIPPDESPAKPLSPEFAKQGGLEGGGFQTAHQITRGKGAKIAILDTGIDPTHPVFQNTRWGPHFSLIGPAGPPWAANAPVVDWGFHGTLISSVAAVYAPEARLTMYKFGDGDTQNDPPFGYLMECLVAACIYRAVHDGNDIISISASGATLDVPYLREACQYAYDQNKVVISGNLYMRWYEKGNRRNFPAQYKTVVSVTAAERRKDGTYGYWNVCAPDPTVAVAAPNDVFGAFPTYVDQEDTYIPSISAAIPTVAGLFALAVSEYPPTGKEGPGVYAQTLMDLVLQSADPRKVGYEGFTPECGNGLIDAEKTVAKASALRHKRDLEERGSLLLAEAATPSQAPFLQGKAGRLDDIFSRGRRAFYQELRLDFGLHPQRFQLTPSDAQKIMRAERDIPYLYERVINLAYIRRAPDFERLLDNGGRAAIEEFQKHFVALSREAAGLFVQSLFQEPSRDGPSAERLRNPRESRLQAVLSSLAWEGTKSGQPDKDSGLSSGDDPSSSWGLEVVQARSAQTISRGKGVRIAVLDSGFSDPSGPGSGPSAVPPLLVPLAATTQAPWLDTTSSADLLSPSGGWPAALAAAVAPESTVRVFGINRDPDPVYPLWPAYQVSQGIYKAVDSGMDIILVTAAFATDLPFLKDACAYAYRKNVVVVCPNAAGPFDRNNPEKPTHFPAHYNTTVAVAGVVPGAGGSPVPWEKSEPSHYTTCAAPTVAAGRRIPRASGIPASDNAPAAALVAGTAALICSLLPKSGEELSGQYVQRIYEVLCRSCDSRALGLPGFDPRIGYGLIIADRAVRQEVPAYRERVNQVEASFKKRMEERAAQEQKQTKD